MKEKRNHLNGLERCNLNIFHRIFAFGYKFYHVKSAKILENYDDLTSKLKKEEISKVMIIMGKNVEHLSLHKTLTETLIREKIPFMVYTSFGAHPTSSDIELGALQYKESKSNCIIALGGGTTIDFAKAVGILSTNKGKITSYKGINKVKNKIPLLIAIPTTCGSGSETTISAVLTSDEGDKYTIISNKIVPKYTLFDGRFVKSLPKDVFAYGVMDTLTHAIESYLNYSGTTSSNKNALEAIRIIFKNAPTIFEHSSEDKANIETTIGEDMLKASYLAGKSFSKGMVGNVHSLSHAINSVYPELPHGKINAIILPEMLKEYLKSNYCIRKLDKIADYVGLKNNKLKIQNALNVIDQVLLLNGKFNIPQVLVELKEEDFPKIEEHAYTEAHFLYCTPLIFDIMDYDEILNLIKSNKRD